MKGVSHPTNDVSLNPSSSHSIRDVIDHVDAGRRQFIQGGVGAALAGLGGLQQRQGGEDGVVLHHTLAEQPVHDARIGFKSGVQLLQARHREPAGPRTRDHSPQQQHAKAQGVS